MILTNNAFDLLFLLKSFSSINIFDNFLWENFQENKNYLSDFKHFLNFVRKSLTISINTLQNIKEKLRACLIIIF